MGLDMMLYTRTEVTSEDAYSYYIRHKDKMTEVAYWRKGYSVCVWFFENCKELDEEDGIYYVTFKDLDKLRRIVDEILFQHTEEEKIKVANNLLPAQYTDKYDSWYFSQLRETKRQLDEILLNRKGIVDFIFWAWQ